MKKIFKYIWIVLFIGYSTSCDQNFDELNTNTVSATVIDPTFQLNQAIVSSAPSSFGVLVYEVGAVQHVISPNSGVLTGANFNQDNRASTQANWQQYYRNVIKNTKDVLARIKDDPNRNNLVQMTRIIQANAFMVLTDTYGSIPYRQAGAGFSDQVFFPEYDAQELIYTDIIKELAEASSALGTSGRIETADVLFAGNVEKWKKFGYSLLLRAGMRIGKANPTAAQQAVAQAFAGGVILSNDDNVIIKHDPNYVNPIGNTLNATEAANFYLTEPFVNFMKNTDDPRLRSIAVRYVGASSGPEQTVSRQSYEPELQIGMPLGNDNAGAVQVAANLGLASFYDFSQVDRRRMVKLTSPNFIVTAAMTQLLLAEARQLGWITTGTVQDYFHAGIRAHMNQMPSYDPAMEIPSTDIDTYINANPLIEATAIQQINEQYWIATFMQGPESFANFRRSGFPTLDPNPFPGREAVFINRLTYPNSEISVNSENVQAAISAQGPDNLETRVWWHK
jgi:hypothetical protein